ncbi:hypothetical protein DAPPUDRAFT_312778 [Daphnia pulex]|uniref:Uncharacterized protein n=1 Tax=Daphnia pulex TaxID=6669 RepID=E9G1I8_DAPPU|nr:hypothetical protein DAPPUDRAFT_312778 [Daphnia pulex]|eukprot:EFX86807.1 hypothetical protein DAPPUDRAFT_312778 [Daphnia pulex]
MLTVAAAWTFSRKPAPEVQKSPTAKATVQLNIQPFTAASAPRKEKEKKTRTKTRFHSRSDWNNRFGKVDKTTTMSSRQAIGIQSLPNETPRYKKKAFLSSNRRFPIP